MKTWQLAALVEIREGNITCPLSLTTLRAVFPLP
jgi:hypothetical protein